MVYTAFFIIFTKKVFWHAMWHAINFFVACHLHKIFLFNWHAYGMPWHVYLGHAGTMACQAIFFRATHPSVEGI